MMKKSSLAYLTMLLVIILGSYMWYLQPERALSWAAAMFVLPAGTIFLLFIQKIENPEKRVKSANKIHLGMIGGGLILATALLAGIADHLTLFNAEAGEISDRAIGAIYGVILAVYANFIPKSAASAKKQSMLRFGGWVFVLAGLGYAIAWMISPFENADTVSVAIMGSGLALVLGRVGWAYIKKCDSPPNPGA